jgi:hypothetical protein
MGESLRIPLSPLCHNVAPQYAGVKRHEPKKSAKLPIKMTDAMYDDLEAIGDELGDRSKAWVARKFINEGIERYKKERPKKRAV